MVGFCGRCRDERIDVSCDFRHLMNKAHVTRWPLSSLVAQSRAVALQFIPPHLLQLHPTQITPQSHLSLLCPWLSVMSVDPCWGRRSHQEGSFINDSYMSPQRVSMPGSGVQERRRPLCVGWSGGWWQTLLRMTVLPRSQTRLVTEQGIGFCLYESEVLKHQKK